MFRNLMITLALKALQQGLCQFFGYCIEFDECPDGVCDEAISALNSLDEKAPAVQLATSKAAPLTAPAISPDFSKLQPVVSAVVELIAAIKDFLGIEPRVGA